jgi:hypothetical protein
MDNTGNSIYFSDTDQKELEQEILDQAVLITGDNDQTGKQKVINIEYKTRNIFCNGQNPAFNIITDVDADQYRQVFVNTTSADTDGCTIDRVATTGEDGTLLDIYVNLATLKVVHNQGGLGTNEYPIFCPGNVGFQTTSDNVNNKYKFVRLFFNKGLGAWYLESLDDII